MTQAGIAVLISGVLLLAAAGPCLAQDGGGGRDDSGARSWVVDKQGNGQPAQAKVDPDAVARLEAAEAAFAEDGKERDAIAQALAVLPAFENTTDYDHLVDCLFLLGEAYYYVGEWANAEKYMSRAADLGFRYFADEMSSYPLKVIGESQHQLGRDEEALASFQERVQKLRKSSDGSDLASALFDVGGILINLGREEEALPVLQEALQANNTRAAEINTPGSNADDSEREGNVIDHAEINYHIAIAYFRQEKYADALTYLNEAYSFFNSVQQAGKHDMQDRLVSVLDDLVVTNEQLGHTADAEKYRAERDKLNH
jgi:tetratricopeptide (TPR) repeat protein